MELESNYLDCADGFDLFYTAIHNIPLPVHARVWIDEIYVAREDANKGTVIEAFRGSTKTTTMLTFVAWRIGLEPQRANLIVQVSDDSAKKNAATVAAIIEYNAGWKEFFPNIVPDKDAGWGGNGYEVMDTNHKYEEWRRLNSKRQDPTLFAGGRTSHALIGKHPDGVCLLDDLDDETTTRSMRETLKTEDLLTGTIFPTYRPETWKIVIGTPWTEKDVIAYCKSTGEFRACHTPVQQGKELTWPSVFNEEEIKKQRKLAGEVEFARMFMLDLEMAKGNILKKEWLTDFAFEDIAMTWHRFMGVDYASTRDKLREGADRDFFAVYWGALHPNGYLIIEDGYVAKISQAEAEKKIISLCSNNPYLKQVGVESIGKGEEFCTLLMRAPVFMPIFPIPSHTGLARSKGGRFEKVLAKMFEFNRIRISTQKTEALKIFRDQWISWDGTDTYHDDALDAVYMMVKAAEGHIAVPQEQASIEPNSPYFGKKKKKVDWSGMKYG